MATTPVVYKVVHWGPPVGEGSTEAIFVTLQAVAKLDSDQSFCFVAVEYISARIASLLGLPCPPSGMIRTDDGVAGFFSLRFGPLEHTPAPIIPQRMVEEWPDIAAGVVVFDCLIHNADRHAENIAYQGPNQAPVIFDHSHAFAVNGVRADLSTIDSRSDEIVEDHCLAPHIESSAPLGVWVDRVRGLRPWMIEPTIDEAIAMGIAPADCRSPLIDWLLARRDNIWRLLQQQMTHVADWPLDGGGEDDD